MYLMLLLLAGCCCCCHVVALVSSAVAAVSVATVAAASFLSHGVFEKPIDLHFKQITFFSLFCVFVLLLSCACVCDVINSCMWMCVCSFSFVVSCCYCCLFIIIRLRWLFFQEATALLPQLLLLRCLFSAATVNDDEL